jgi:hypothetical protein
MELPTTIYELTPTFGMAVEAPTFQQVDTTDKVVGFRVTAKAYPVRREHPGGTWRPIPVCDAP